MATHMHNFDAAKNISSHRTLRARHVQTRTSARFYRDYLKRGLDIAFILLTLPVAVPLIAVLALIAARDGASPFYRQSRVGRNGVTFTMFKIRTMVNDADDRLETYLADNPSASVEWDSTQKLKHDPRITSIGHFMRRSSLDELPQLWNVLRGDMSLIGPRPMMVSQQSLYPGRSYYEMRPGITGLWQVSDRNESTFADRARFDTRYVETLSFKNDLMILFKTVGAVLRCTGH
ncbi:sugar transferase [Ruegeria sp.]|uniref:sugar transferase n=1 Tax=Ruegeria sp. TaxID=1879320 RepID=UPI0023101A6B|nr:sugar transferase [Ruegeria sp.]MDA7965969.1 sugar transferase [Ruegeria sp.]